MDSPRTNSPRGPAMSIIPPPPPLPGSSGGGHPPLLSPSVSTTNALTLILQQALAKGDLSKSLESMASLLSLSGDNRLKADLLLKLIDLTKHFTSLIVAAPTHTAPLLKCLRLLLVDKEPTLRSQSLRVLRYLLTDWEMVHQMLLINLDLFIVRSLERESKYLWERMQALKFIRKWMNMLSQAQAKSKENNASTTNPPVKGGVQPRGAIGLTRSLVQSLVSIAEQPKDDFRRVCLDAIRELTLLSPGIVASCNGIRTLVDSILDPACVDIANSLTLTLLYLIDSELTRGFLRPSVDLVRLISVFTDTTAADNPERENRRAAAHKALVMLMRSWTGILVLTSDPQCLKALIGMLNLPPSIKGSSWARETIFDLLFEIIHVVKAQDVRAMATRIRNSMTASVTDGTQFGGNNLCHAYPPNLLYSYMVMLLLSFLTCDLVEILTSLALSSDPDFALVASKLLGEILGLSSELLPKELCKYLNSMKVVISTAASFEKNENMDSGGVVTIGGAAANQDISDSALITRRVRAVTILSSLSHAELHHLGPALTGGFGNGNASITAHTAPGTGWAWTGPLGVNWEAVHHAASQNSKENSRRDSHEWNTTLTDGGRGMVRNNSFSSRSNLSSSSGGGGGSQVDTEYTPSGRRAVLHGIRLERLAIRSEVFPSGSKTRLISSGAYGASVASNTDSIAPIACLTSQSALTQRNHLQHRLGVMMKNQYCIAANGGTYAPNPASSTTNSTSSDYHAEESELAPYLKKSNVLNTKDFKAWDWEYIQIIIERFMLLSPSHTSYLILKTKFPKRLLSFLRSDKKHFTDLDWSPYHLKFVRMGIALLKSMLSCPEGREYSWFGEFIDGVFLAVLWEIASTDGKKDGGGVGGGTGFVSYGPTPATTNTSTSSSNNDHPSSYIAGRRLSHLSSGLTKAKAKVFATFPGRAGCTSRLIREYFVFLGILSSSPYGNQYFEKYAFHDVLLNLARDGSKDYITKLLLANLNFWNGPNAVTGGAKAWRKILEVWLTVPTAPATSGTGSVVVSKEGCNIYLRLWAVEYLLIWWRKHQASGGSQAIASETEVTGAGVLQSQPPSSITQIVSQAALASPAATQPPLNDSYEASVWAIGLLLAQLTSLDSNLRSSCLNVIEEMVTHDPIALHALIQRRPVILKDLAHLTHTPSAAAPSQPLFPAAQRLLMLFLSSRAGVEFLRVSAGLGSGASDSWLDIQLAEWRHTHGGGSGSACTTYVRGLEDALIAALSSNSKEDSEHLNSGEEGLSVAGGGGSGGSNSSPNIASKLDELSAPPAITPPNTNNAWCGPILRSALDDYIFERLHALPWIVDLTVEYPQGRSVQLMTECWVITTSHGPASNPAAAALSQTPPPHLSRAASSSEDLGQGVNFSSAASASSESVPTGAPVTYLVCQVLDLEGNPKPQKVEGNVTLRARISIGAGVHSQNVQDLSVNALQTSTPSSSSTNGHPSSTRGVSSFTRGFNNSDLAASFQEERESEREWAKTFFPDHSGHASEYVCRARDREKLNVDNPFIITQNQSELCMEDEARWMFEVPDPASAPMTHTSVRGGTVGTSPPGVITLESVWFPIPMPTSTVPSVSLLPHLYGELVRTDEGTQVLAASGQIKELEKSIREGGLSGTDGTVVSHSMDSSPYNGFIHIPSAASSLEKRAALWAIGHIGSTSFGFQLLNQQAPGLVAYISEQAVACSTLSMRGTCFYILGLLGRSPVGRSSLSALGWSFSPFPGGCIAIPTSIRLGGSGDVCEEERLKRVAELEQLEEEEDEDEPIETRPTTTASTRSSISMSPPPLATTPSISTTLTTTTSNASSSTPLAGFLSLDWPASSYRGSWATDPSNIYGINSSKRTRKVGGVDAGGAGGDAAGAAAAATTKPDDTNEILSSTEGIEVILSHLSNLCNHVTQKTSLQALRTMKSQPHHAHFFTSPLLLFETFKLLACYSYKLPARRFLFFDLFGSVAFNMHTITQFDQTFLSENVSSYQKQKLRESSQQQQSHSGSSTANSTPIPNNQTTLPRYVQAAPIVAH